MKRKNRRPITHVLYETQEDALEAIKKANELRKKDIIHGGSANGLREWKTKEGKPLKELDEQA